MAKGQQRSNKEKKKPKQDKAKAAPAGATTSPGNLFRKVDDDKNKGKGKR